MNDENEPLKTEDKDLDAAPAGPNYPKVAGMISMMLTVGTVVAYYGIFKRNGGYYEARIDALLGDNENDNDNGDNGDNADLHWLYLGLVLLGRTIAALNFLPMGYKKGLTGSIRSNPFFFETTGGTSGTTSVSSSSSSFSKQMVLYKEDGVYGRYNRANRSLQNMVEQSGGFFAAVGPVGFLYPKPVCGILALFGAGRLLHQNGYSKGYGKHAGGFVLTLLAMVTLEGLALLTFLRGAGIL